MIRAVVADDEVLARQKLRQLLRDDRDVEIVGESATAQETIELVRAANPELLFLDIHMPGMDGFDVVSALAQQPEIPSPRVIFTTAYDQYALRAFDVNAVDYLLKPFDRGRVSEAVERARTRIAAGAPSAASGAGDVGAGGAADQSASAPPTSSQIDALLKLLSRSQGAERAAQPAKLIVQAQSRLLLVDQADICFAAIDEGVIRIVTRSFEGQSKCRTLEELQELLDSAHFWRAHRGFVVNIDHIREVVPWFKSSYQLRMNDKQQTEIPVSRAQTKRLRELFNL